MKLSYQFKLIQAIRNFFLQEGFIDVLTPPVVQNPGMETHIHPFQLYSANNDKVTTEYLHTSPEFAMKGLLAREEFEKIFTISYAFRDEPSSPIHRNQFLMLEWYRKHERYEKIMDDVERLIKYTASECGFENKITTYQHATVAELFEEYLGFNILDFLDTNDLLNKIKFDIKDVPLPSSLCHWDDYFFLIFLNKIEPHFKEIPYLLVKEFPYPLSALSTISHKDPRVSERFEVYLNGIELCNCFNELTNFNEQKERFELQAKEKQELYNYKLPWPADFMNTIQSGYPKSSGIALGIERLLKALSGTENPFF